MKNYLSIGALLIVLLITLAACASPETPVSEPSTASEVVEPEEKAAEMAESEAETEMAEGAETEMEAKPEVVAETGPSAQEVAQMERAAAGTIRDNERAGNRAVEEAEAAEDEVRSLASFLPDLGDAPEIDNGEPWINSDPLTLGDLEGKVVVIEFWTYS